MFPSAAQADSMTGFNVDISTQPNGDLVIMTTRIMNGDTYERAKWLYSMEQIVHYECDAQWKCQEGKGSTRHRYLAYAKPKGGGYVLIKEIMQYESVQWDRVWVVDADHRLTALDGFRPGCQDLFWSADGTRLIVSERGELVVFDLESGKTPVKYLLGDPKQWRKIVSGPCPRYDDVGGE